MFQLFLSLTFIFSCAAQAAPDSFSFHLHTEPHSLDSSQLRGVSGKYLFNNLYRSLYSYDNKKGLVPEGAEKCSWENTHKLSCSLNIKRKWSDGTPILAKHYEYAFKRLIDPKTKSLKIERLLPLKNAKKILKGQLSAQSLGVRALGNFTLEFTLESPDPNFIYSLTSPSFAPQKNKKFPAIKQAAKLLTNGPYKIQSWDRYKGIRLVSNIHYPGHKNRPPVQVYFVDSHDSAFRLFEAKKLNFLRLLTTDRILKFQDKDSFILTNLSRFDYIGFSNDLLKNSDLRKAMAYSLNYPQLAKIYHARGVPGCPSLPKTYMSKQHCYNFDLKKAKKHFAKVPDLLKTKKWKLGYSKMGGEDIKRGMEWVAYQWKVNLGLNVELRPVERGMYLKTLRSDIPDIFRKGLTLDRPTCLAALKNFKDGNHRNYIKYNNHNYQNLLDKMLTPLSVAKTKQICSKAIKILLDDYVLIPLGEIHFSQLQDGNFEGWRINEMDQLDLAQLKRK